MRGLVDYCDTIATSVEHYHEKIDKFTFGNDEVPETTSRPQARAGTLSLEQCDSIVISSRQIYWRTAHSQG